MQYTKSRIQTIHMLSILRMNGTISSSLHILTNKQWTQWQNYFIGLVKT